jgi:hypothetical protein
MMRLCGNAVVGSEKNGVVAQSVVVGFRYSLRKIRLVRKPCFC